MYKYEGRQRMCYMYMCVQIMYCLPVQVFLSRVRRSSSCEQQPDPVYTEQRGRTFLLVVGLVREGGRGEMALWGVK